MGIILNTKLSRKYIAVSSSLIKKSITLYIIQDD